jgi:hypothetical protein
VGDEAPLTIETEALLALPAEVVEDIDDVELLIRSELTCCAFACAIS